MDFLKIFISCESLMKTTFPAFSNTDGINHTTWGLKSQALPLCFYIHSATLVVFMDGIHMTTDVNI